MATRTASRTTSRRTTSYSTSRARRGRDVTEPVRLRTLVAGGAAVLFVAILFWYMTHGGWGQMVNGIYRASAHAGLKVEEVFITGRTNLNRDELLASIGVERGDPLLAIDMQNVYEQVTANAWVASARIERHLPNVLYIALTERKPYARWQSGQKLRLVDAEGVVLSEQLDDIQRFPDLPLIVGDGAPKSAAALLEVLRDFPAIRQQTEAMVRVSDRRWDLHLQNGMTIKLPDGDPATTAAAALTRVQNMWQSADFVGKGVKVIDARMADRLVIDSAEKEAAKP